MRKILVLGCLNILLLIIGIIINSQMAIIGEEQKENKSQSDDLCAGHTDKVLCESQLKCLQCKGGYHPIHCNCGPIVVNHGFMVLCKECGNWMYGPYLLCNQCAAILQSCRICGKKSANKIPWDEGKIIPFRRVDQKKEQIKNLIAQLNNENMKLRDSAQACLISLGKESPLIISLIIEASKNQNDDTRKRVSEIIDAIGPVVDGLKLNAMINQEVFKKGDTFKLTVEWLNIGKDEMTIQRKMKTNPLMILNVTGDLAYRIAPAGIEWWQERSSNESIKIRPGRKVTISKKSNKWAESEYIDTETKKQHKEWRLSIDGFDDDFPMSGLKAGSYTIVVITRLANKKEVRSNPISFKIIE